MMRIVLILASLFLALAARAQPAPNPSFTLANRSAQPIKEVYATPAGVDRWGLDRLASAYIPPGASFPVRLLADGNCLYDIRVIYADGRAEERRRVNTCALDTLTFPGGGATAGTPDAGRPPAGSEDPSFRLVNRGRAEINELYVSEPGNERWGRDRLGDATVPPGGMRVIRMPPGLCLYDVRAVFAGGEAVERRRVNLCAVTNFPLP